MNRFNSVFFLLGLMAFLTLNACKKEQNKTDASVKIVEGKSMPKNEKITAEIFEIIF